MSDNIKEEQPAKIPTWLSIVYRLSDVREKSKGIKMATTTEAGKFVMTTVLENMRRNIIKGCEDARKHGIEVETPESVEIDMPIDCNGLPCTTHSLVAGRFQATLKITQPK